MAQSSASICNVLKKKVLPVVRKPDYISTYVRSDEEEENQGSNNITGGESRGKENSIPMLNPENLVVETDNKNVLIDSKDEKRNMFVRIEQAELDTYGIDFIENNEKSIRFAVKTMCHSLRFWLVVKFCQMLDSNEINRKREIEIKLESKLTISKICQLFGIGKSSFFKFRSSNGKSGQNQKTLSDYDGYSPLEYANLKNYVHPKVLKKLALNYQALVEDGIVKFKN